jgi:hypothetical protein
LFGWAGGGGGLGIVGDSRAGCEAERHGAGAALPRRACNASATAHADDDAPGNTGPTAGLTQTVATAAGQFYGLSFCLANAQSSATTFYNLPSALTAFGKSAV